MSNALDSFLDKWRSRWPEWNVAEPFIPQSQRHTALAWFALLQEFEDIMNIAGDTLPADAKLAWWQQELRDWSGQRSRHPLGRVLEPWRAPWGQLADALPAIQEARLQPTSMETAVTRLQLFAEAVVAIEAVLFERATRCDARTVALQYLYSRVQAAAGEAVPNDISVAQWRAQLLRLWPVKAELARPHRVWARLARLRLRREQAGQAVYAPPLSQLWNSWRAASGSP